MGAPTRGGEGNSSSWLLIKSWASIQRGCRSVDGGDLGDACMKASGEGAGTKAGLGVEESRADKTEGAATRKNRLTLPVLTRYLCVQAGERKVRVILVSAMERVLLACEVWGSKKLIYFDLIFFAACCVDALRSIFDISRPSRRHICTLEL